MRLSLLSVAVRSSLTLGCIGFISSLAMAEVTTSPETMQHMQNLSQNLPEVTLNEIVVVASADASRKGLPSAYQGGQVATGSRVGILGNHSIMETPFSTTAYTNEFIQNKQADTVGDVLRHDSGVRVARGYGNFQEAYVMRGFVTDSDDTMFNGLYGILPRQSIATPLFERVEVQRGASAFLNGAAPGGGNIGGTISLLPKRAGNTDLNRVTLGYGAGNRGEIGTDISRRFGANNAYGVRFNGALSDGDTAIDDEKAKLGLASLGLDYRQDNVRVSADLGWQDNKLKQTRTNVGVTATGVPKAPDSDNNWAQPWAFSNEKDVFGTLRGEYDFSDNLTGFGAYGFRQSDEANSLANISVKNTDGTGSTYRFDNTRKDSVNTGELGVRGKLDTANLKHNWVVSGTVFSLDKKNAYALDPANSLATNLYHPTDYSKPDFTANAYTGGKLSDPKKTNETQLSSIAIGDTIGLMNDKLQATLGVRYQTIETTGFDYNTQKQTTHYKKSETTPALGLNYKVNDMVSVYGNYIESLKVGETATQQFNGNVVANSGEQLAPYVSKQTEIGAKYDSGTIGGGIAVFNIKQPRSYYDANNGYRFTAKGENQHTGVELNVYGSPTYNTRLLGGVTFLKAEQKDTGDTTLNGNDRIGVPKFQANIGAEYDVSQLEGLTLVGDVAHTGSSYLDNANKLKVDGYTTLNLGARYKTNLGAMPVTVRGDIENVTNEKYWEVGSSYGGYLNAGQPRGVKLSASFDF